MWLWWVRQTKREIKASNGTILAHVVTSDANVFREKVRGQTLGDTKHTT